MTIEQEMLIEGGLIFLGFEVHPDECTIDPDGSVWYEFNEILPPGSIFPE